MAALIVIQSNKMQLNRGDLVRLRLTGDLFEIVEVFDNGRIKIAHPGLQMVTGADAVDLYEPELAEAPEALMKPETLVKPAKIT
jgi:hypothetical protein